MRTGSQVSGGLRRSPAQATKNLSDMFDAPNFALKNFCMIMTCLMTTGLVTSCGGGSSSGQLDNSLARDVSLNDSENPTISDANTLSFYLATGRDGDDSDSYWQCVIGAAGNQANVPIRLFSDGSGFAGETALQWSAQTNDTLEMTTASGLLRTSDLVLQTVDNLFDQFSGTDDTGTAIDCAWSGRSRYDSTFASFQDQNLFSTLLVGESQSENYTCQATQLDGSSVGHSLILNVDRSAVLDGQPMRWYLDLGNDLVLSNLSTHSITVLSNINYSAIQASGPKGFTAEYEDVTIDCATNF